MRSDTLLRVLPPHCIVVWGMVSCPTFFVCCCAFSGSRQHPHIYFFVYCVYTSFSFFIPCTLLHACIRVFFHAAVCRMSHFSCPYLLFFLLGTQQGVFSHSSVLLVPAYNRKSCVFCGNSCAHILPAHLFFGKKYKSFRI